MFIFHGFHPCCHDLALFLKCTKAGHIIYFFVYIDDVIIIGDDVNGIVILKSYLVSCFTMKDLSSLRYFLSIEVAFSLKGYLLS